MTFDTSLVDVKPSTADTNASFSTIESDQANYIQPKPSTPIHHVATQDAYNQWASVYDSDGNMLQAIDDIELATLLPDFLAQVINTTTTTTNNDNENTSVDFSSSFSSSPLRILDLGCGTGRNTLKLVSHAFPTSSPIHIQGLDFSQPMLDIARTKLSALSPDHVAGEKTWSLHCCDVFSAAPVVDIPPAHGIISTLVLEHIPLTTFFVSLASLLQPCGLALVTNMHQDMGSKGSQAGFVNQQGVKVRGESFVHTVEEMVGAAREAGLEVLELREREVSERDVEGEGAMVGRRGRKWVGVKVWAGMVVRRRG